MAGIPGAAGPGAPYPQWLFNTTTHTVSEVSNSTAKAIANAVSWPAKIIYFTSEKAADAYMTSQGGGGDISKSPLAKVANATTSNPLDALAGDLAAGIEHGVIVALKDIWMTIYPALEVLSGVGLVILAFVLIFKGQIMSLAPLVAALA